MSLVSMSVHGARDIVADAGPTTGAPLSLRIDGDMRREVTFFTDDHALSRKLADAINETVRAHMAEKAGREAA